MTQLPSIAWAPDDRCERDGTRSASGNREGHESDGAAALPPLELAAEKGERRENEKYASRDAEPRGIGKIACRLSRVAE